MPPLLTPFVNGQRMKAIGLVVELYRRFLLGGNQLFICKAKAVKS